MNPLATLDELKTRLNIDSADTSEDDLLASMLLFTTLVFQAKTGRYFEFLAGETQLFHPIERPLLLNRPPLISLTTLEYSEDNATWENVTDQIAPTTNESGNVLDLLNLSPRYWPGTLRATYSGGYTLPPDIAAPPNKQLPDDLHAACIEQAAWYYNNRQDLGATQVTREGGSRKFQAKTDLLTSVTEILKRYTLLKP